MQTVGSDLELWTAEEMVAQTAAPRVGPKSKLRRLLDLTADALESGAPNATHPAVGHARIFRAVVERTAADGPVPDSAQREPPAARMSGPPPVGGLASGTAGPTPAGALRASAADAWLCNAAPTPQLRGADPERFGELDCARVRARLLRVGVG